jgi:hypothetical protein
LPRKTWFDRVGNFTEYYVHHPLQHIKKSANTDISLYQRRLSLSETYSYVANHENLRFSLSKCFLQIEKRQKRHRFRNLQNFLLNLFFPIQRQKLNTDKVLNRHKTQHSIGDGASNRVECTTYRLILYTYLIFPRGWSSQIFYLVVFIISLLITLRLISFSLLSCVEKNNFYLILIKTIRLISARKSHFSSSKLNFYVTKLSYSKSTLKPASRDVCFQTFYRLSFIDENRCWFRIW